jgi:hypothetical protein
LLELTTLIEKPDPARDFAEDKYQQLQLISCERLVIKVFAGEEAFVPDD